MSSIPSALLKPFYFLMSVVTLFFNWLDIPIKALGAPPDLTGYELVWADEFDGTALDTTKWRGELSEIGELRYYGSNNVGDDYYSHDSLMKVEDGYLTLSIRHIENDPDLPDGWYCFNLDSAGLAEFTYGYFECRAKLAKSRSANCAFWMNSAGSSDYSVPPEEAVEIDIFESMQYDNTYHGCVERNMHYFYGDKHERLHARFIKVGGNPYEEFNTYAVKWDEKGYTFYVNGREFNHTDFGLCHGQLYLALCNFMRISDTPSIDGDSADFVVDYVRVYQQA